MENKEKIKFSLDFIHSSYNLKPKELFVPEVKWKLLLRNILKSKNSIITGSSGSAKTKLAKVAAKSLNRPYFLFNMGSMQDPRASLIGNTFFDVNKGTYFNQSDFIKAITTEDAIIILDEITRAHPDANNILLTVIDLEIGERFIRLDEKDGDQIILVAKGVSFIATANIGTEYTGTRVLDRATMDRFSGGFIEMTMLEQEEELELLILEFPDVDKEILELLTKVSFNVREEYYNESGNLTTMMSTRAVKEAAELIQDGFTIAESLEVTLLPLFDENGGASSERQTIKTIISGIIPQEDDLDRILFKATGISPDNPFFNQNNSTI